MPADDPNGLSFDLAICNLREISEQIFSRKDTADPELFESLSRVAAEIAELLRDRRCKRRERASELSTKLREIFPELAEAAAAGLSLFEDGALERMEEALRSATEANERLAASEAKVRTALDNRDYGGVEEHASRAGEYQAAVSQQKEVLAALLASISMSGAADLKRPLKRLREGEMPASEPESAVAEAEPDRDRELPTSEAEAVLPRANLEEPLGEPESVTEHPPEPDVPPEPTLETETGADTFVRAPLRGEAEPAVLPKDKAWTPKSANEHIPASAVGPGPTETAVTSPADEIVNGAFWSALDLGRLGLAQALLEAGALSGRKALLGPAIELAAMALVADGTGEIVDVARETAERALAAWQSRNVSEQASPESVFAASVILLPASIVLALLAPGSNQAGLLSALPTHNAAPADWEAARRLPELCAMARRTAEAIAAVSGQFLPNQELFANLISHEEWNAELRRHCESMKSWIDTQLARTIRYSAATDVWHAMLRPGGVLGQLLAVAVEDRAPRLDWVRREISGLRASAVIRQIETDVRGRVAVRRRPIEGPALRELEYLVEEALQLIRSWVKLRATAPAATTVNRTQPVAELRTALAAGLAMADAELRALAGIAASGVGVAETILRRLGALLSGHLPRREPDTLDELLGRDLICLPQIEFDLNWRRPHPLPSDLMPGLLELCGVQVDPLAAGRKRLSRSDFIGAELALALIGKREGHDESEAESFRREIRKAAGDAKDAALMSLAARRRDIEEAERSGRVEVGTSQELVERINSLRDRLERAEPAELGGYLTEAAAEQCKASDVLNAASSAVRQRIQIRLTNLGRPASAQEQTRIEALLEAGQFAIAEDFVERVEAGEPLPDSSPAIPPAEERFDRFFPKRAEELATSLRPGRLVQLATDPARQIDDPLPAGTRVPQDLPAIVKAWMSCTEIRGNLQSSLSNLLTGLGFTDPEIEFTAPPRAATEALFRLHVRPLRDRDTAVLPEYGSIAAGSYALLCLWRKRDAEDVAQALARHPVVGSTTIVLFFGTLDIEQRRRLALLARADRLRSAILIDGVLMLHLASLDEARLPTLFACTLPFTDSRPWADTGTPPPEMFFGRQRELSAVEARSGEFTHLLYGGRQLGKTALLRQVQRAATGDTVSRYISIAQIGMTQAPGELWGVLANELSSAIPGLAGSGTAARFRSHILEWLDGNPSRRVLLLLDEADNFFIKDREQRFAVTEMLRTLSVERDRRFKPVFAGLRNVQKLARDPNSPLAHLGQPMVIGPLLRGAERTEAEALVRWPFGALGYRMDQLVVTRIVTFANYYPSLIQVVCQRLLRNLRQRHGAMGPPWTVRIDDVDKVLETRELRDAAFERFLITLELDPRYNLLTRLIAHLSIDDPRLLAEGIDVFTLRDFAADAWPAGFPADLGSDAFDAILDEMQGLGLLRQVDGTHYALRSANLAHLIGTQSEIAQQIEGFRTYPAPEERDPLESRRQLKGSPSILTARQEAELLAPTTGVLVLAGIALAEIGEWRGAISAAIEFARSKRDLAIGRQVINRTATIDTYSSELKRLIGENAHPFILLVPPEVHWTAEWIDTTLNALSGLAVARRFRVVFVANAERAWAWLAEPVRRASLISGSAFPLRVMELSVGPWSRESLNLWLQIHDEYDRFPAWLIANQAVPLLEATGGWAATIKRLRGMSQRERPANSGPRALATQLQMPEGPSDLLADIAAIPEAIKVLEALAEAEELHRSDERVDAALVKEASESVDGALIKRALVQHPINGFNNSPLSDRG